MRFIEADIVMASAVMIWIECDSYTHLKSRSRVPPSGGIVKAEIMNGKQREVKADIDVKVVRQTNEARMA